MTSSSKEDTQTQSSFDGKLREVTYFVEEFQRTLHFYEETLGLKPKLKQKGFAEFDVGGVHFAIHENGSPGSENHIAFQVASPEDVDRMYKLLRERGAEFVELSPTGELMKTGSGAPKSFVWGKRGIYLRDPDGNLLEIYADL